MLRSEDVGVHYEAVGVIGNLVHSSQARGGGGGARGRGRGAGGSARAAAEAPPHSSCVRGRERDGEGARSPLPSTCCHASHPHHTRQPSTPPPPTPHPQHTPPPFTPPPPKDIKRQVLTEGALQPVINLLASPCSESQREAALLLGQFATTDNGGGRARAPPSPTPSPAPCPPPAPAAPAAPSPAARSFSPRPTRPPPQVPPHPSPPHTQTHTPPPPPQPPRRASRSAAPSRRSSACWPPPTPRCARWRRSRWGGSRRTRRTRWVGGCVGGGVLVCVGGGAPVWRLSPGCGRGAAPRPPRRWRAPDSAPPPLAPPPSPRRAWCSAAGCARCWTSSSRPTTTCSTTRPSRCARARARWGETGAGCGAHGSRRTACCCARWGGLLSCAVRPVPVMRTHRLAPRRGRSYGLSDNEDNVGDIVREGGMQRLMECSEKLQVQASKVRCAGARGRGARGRARRPPRACAASDGSLLGPPLP